MIADLTFSLYKKNKSKKNKKFQSFKKEFQRIQRNNANSENCENYFFAKAELNNHLTNITNARLAKKRLDKFNSSSIKASNIYSMLGRNNSRAVPSLLDPDSNKITNESSRIAKIFTDNFSSKTIDSQNLQAAPKFDFPNIDVLHSMFGTQMADIFPDKPLLNNSLPFSTSEILRV